MAYHGETKREKKKLEDGVTAVINLRYCCVHFWVEVDSFSQFWDHDLCGTESEREQGEIAENLKRAA